MLKVKSKYLLIIAAVVWFIAGLNIMRLGIEAIEEGVVPLLWLIVGIAGTFLGFHGMFTKLIGKHSDRIRDYGDQRKSVFYFFDLKGYVIMIIMMGGGIALRAFGIFPSWFVAFFYTGLGAALTLAGIGFLVHYLKRGGEIVCPVTKKSRPA